MGIYVDFYYQGQSVDLPSISNPFFMGIKMRLKYSDRLKQIAFKTDFGRILSLFNGTSNVPIEIKAAMKKSLKSFLEKDLPETRKIIRYHFKKMPEGDLKETVRFAVLKPLEPELPNHSDLQQRQKYLAKLEKSVENNDCEIRNRNNITRDGMSKEIGKTKMIDYDDIKE
jgi:hypothetical protein